MNGDRVDGMCRLSCRQDTRSTILDALRLSFRTLVLRIIADENIPLLHAATAGLGDVRAMPGRAIDRAAAMQADVLLVRSVTPVGQALLGGTPVRFVGTATAGTDHVDVEALRALGVAWAAAPGSNAASVVDWVLAALLATAADRSEALAVRPDGTPRTLAVLGVGQVGRRLAARARALGLGVRLCDPPQARAAEAAGEPHGYLPLYDALDGADIVSLHTPYIADGPDATHHLVDAGALARLAPGAWVANAARGRCLDGDALLAALGTGHVAEALLDVWPHEPAPRYALAARCRIATPHVAGYAADAKVRGTEVVAGALRRWLAGGSPSGGADLAQDLDAAALAPWGADAAFDAPRPAVTMPPDPATPTAALDALARQGYDVRADTARFRGGVPWDAADAARAAAFARLRKTYPLRREWGCLAVSGPVPPELRPAVTGGLGMTIA